MKKGFEKINLKKTKSLTLTVLNSALALAVITLMSCKGTKSQDPGVAPAPVVDGADPIIIDDATDDSLYGSGFGSGSTSTFVPVSLQRMNEYVAVRPLNNPRNFKVNLNLEQTSQGRYGGAVSISYIDNNLQYNGIFNAGVGTNQQIKGLYDNGVLESQYNYWFKLDNKLVFSAYFEDQYGAITVTLVPESTTPTSGNDAEPIPVGPYKGYIYFKNFSLTAAPHSPYRHCWFTYTGPYDCRSNVIHSKGGYFPGPEAGYKLLGTFSGVDIKSAFNIQD